MKIVFVDAITTNPGDVSLSCIEALGEFIAFDRTEPQELIGRVSDADIIISNKVIIGDHELEQLPNLKYIVVAATGYNNIDIEAARKRNIPVSNVRNYSTESVVQQLFASLLSILNKPEYYNTEVKKGRWSATSDFCFYDHSIPALSSLTFGIIGLGNIGQKVKEVATSFGMQVMDASVREVKSNNSQKSHLFNVLNQSDIVSLHCPLTSETKEIVNKEFLGHMKKGSILINTARGPLLHVNDVLQALDSGVLNTLIVDVLEKEPPENGNPLIAHPKVFITPHIAWANKGAREALIKGISENIRSFINGKLINVVNE